jgi:hypothetical protein
VSLKEAFIVLGITIGYAIGYSYSATKGGWRYTYGWSIPVAIAMFLGMSYLPYSARYNFISSPLSVDNSVGRNSKYVMQEVELRVLRLSYVQSIHLLDCMLMTIF